MLYTGITVTQQGQSVLPHAINFDTQGTRATLKTSALDGTLPVGQEYRIVCTAPQATFTAKYVKVDALNYSFDNLHQLAATARDEAVALQASSATAGASTSYTVTIEMETTTVNDLQAGGYYLFGFKAVGGGGGGLPVVWFSTQNFSTNTPISWQEQYAAYVSLQTEITNGVTIQASNTVSIGLGETLTVTSPNGLGTVSETGPAGSISFINNTTTQFSCGISQPSSAGAPPTPTCVFPLYGNQEDVLTPIEKVLLIFASKPTNTGTVIEQAFSSGILIDLTGAPQNSRSVKYVMNQGWDWQAASWGQGVPVGAALVPLLIDSSRADKRARK